MKQSLNKHTLFNTLAMASMESTGLILVVEGHDDHFILKSHIAADVLLIESNGRPSALGAARLAQARGLRKTSFLVDAELDHFTTPAADYPENVVCTDHHDVVMDLILAFTPAIDRVIDAHCRSAVRSGRAQQAAAEIRRRAMSLAARVALLRIANELGHLCLNLADFPFGRLQSVEPSSIEIARLAIGRSSVTMSEADLAARIEGVEKWAGVGEPMPASDDNAPPPLDRLPGDHDFFGALARVLTENGVRNASPSALQTSYLSVVSCSSVVATSWFKAIPTSPVEAGNKVFSCPCAA